MKSTKVVIYNILFGMKGNSAVNMALSNLSMHGLRPALSFGLLPQWMRKKTVPLRNRHLTEALNMVAKHDPDIICFNEILVDIHKEELETALKSKGYSTIIYGICSHHPAPFRISLVLASKARATEIPFDMTMEPRPGGAGGAAAFYIPEQNLAVLGVHLALFESILDKELEEVNAWIQEQKALGRKILMMGDFNLEKRKMEEKIPAMTSFRETAHLTCPSFYTFLKRPECIDHIFYDENFTETGSGAEAGLSDHKLVWSELSTPS